MYAGRVACCRLVSRVEYAPRSLLRFEKDGTDDGRTDGRQPGYHILYGLFDVWVVILHTPESGKRRDFLWRIPADRRSVLSTSIRIGKPSITFKLLCFPR